MKPDDQNQHGLPIIAPGRMTISAHPVKVSLRSYLSPQYLWAAKHFTTKADEIEQRGGRADAKLFLEHRAYVTGAIFSAVAFLEATVNEFFKDVADQEQGGYSASITREAGRVIRMLWEMTEGRNRSPFSILDKYQLVLTSCEKDSFHCGEKPYQDANLVIKLRNELTHYKPATFVMGENQHEFAKQFKGKFIENRLLAGSESLYFPDKCLGSSCAGWVVQSVTNLADEFFRRLGVKPHYQPAPS